MRYPILAILFLLSSVGCSQTLLRGFVRDEKGKAVFAANVYLKSNPDKGTTTNFDGAFSLKINNNKDTLIVSFIGFKTKEVSLASVVFNKPLVITLEENAQSLNELIVTARNPISEKFSVVKMTKMDIYFNPVSQGDPLKAITLLPASTTTNETANPSLRGSAAERSRVILNGVPIYKPVRASQLNNQGFFSLFNPEIIDNMYVYASNPPLTYGNTSAGLIQIQTDKEIGANQLQLSASLASTGFFLSQKIKNNTSFIQVYGNYQFSNAFVGIQKSYLPNIKAFRTNDAGINFHTKIGKRIAFNSFNYFINEKYSGLNELFTFKGDIDTKKKRVFTVNNLYYFTKKGLLSLNLGANTSESSFSFGNIRSKNNINQLFGSINYKWLVLESLNFQFGVSYDYSGNIFNDSVPAYYYALSPSSPSFASDTVISNHFSEAYLYATWNINKKWVLSYGIRSNIPMNNRKYYLSYQIGLKYRLSNKQSFLLSGGRYHSFSIPDYYSHAYNLLSSYQIALDYSFRQNNTLLKAATYFKNETGKQTVNLFYESGKTNTFGLELFYQQNFYKYFRFTFSNSFIKQFIEINNKKYRGQKDFNYLIKTTLQYNNPKLFSVALSYIGRPGTPYNPIIGSTFDAKTGFYKPTFSPDLFSAHYKSYNRIDFIFNKYIGFKKSALVVFASLNNILNNKNERRIFYNSYYSARHFDYFQYRTLYFGVVLEIGY